MAQPLHYGAAFAAVCGEGDYAEYVVEVPFVGEGEGDFDGAVFGAVVD